MLPTGYITVKTKRRQCKEINPGTRQNSMKAWRIRDTLEEENITNTTVLKHRGKSFRAKRPNVFLSLDSVLGGGVLNKCWPTYRSEIRVDYLWV